MPHVRPLPNKPLVEAIFEMQWQIPPEHGDPHYSLFPGRLSERVASDYPHHEPLPSSMIPHPPIVNVVQHRFRVRDGGWPLIQVGPGLVTLNDTEGYDWTGFGVRAKQLVVDVFETYPSPRELTICGLLLRYIDAIPYDANQEELLGFLEGKLKIKLALPSILFEDIPVRRRPVGLSLEAVFPCDVPKGTILVKLSTGTHRGSPAVILDTQVRARGDQIPEMPAALSEWVEAAHTLTDDWFFKLIEGDLERIFASEH